MPERATPLPAKILRSQKRTKRPCCALSLDGWPSSFPPSSVFRIIAFSFIRLLPGDPVMLMSGERVMSPERHAQIMAELGFDRPMYLQYFDYLGNLLQGDFGSSIVTKRPVLDEFLALFPATVELSLCAILVAVALGIPAGVLAAVKRGTWLDQTIMGMALVGYSMPIFWWGLLLIIFFSGYLGWTPVSGRISLTVFLPAGDGLHADRQSAVRSGRRLQVGASPI